MPGVSVWGQIKSVECAENVMMTRERRLMQRALLPSQPGPATDIRITTDLKYFLATHHTAITNPQNWPDTKNQWSQQPVTHWSREYEITNINDFNLAAFAPNGFDYYVCKMLQSIRVLCRHQPQTWDNILDRARSVSRTMGQGFRHSTC